MLMQYRTGMLLRAPSGQIYTVISSYDNIVRVEAEYTTSRLSTMELPVGFLAKWRLEGMKLEFTMDQLALLADAVKHRLLLDPSIPIGSDRRAALTELHLMLKVQQTKERQVNDDA